VTSHQDRPSTPRDPVEPTRSRFAVVWACVWGGITLAMLFLAVAQWTGLDPAPDAEAALGAVFMALFTGALSVAGVVMARVRRPRGGEPAPSIHAEKRVRLPRAGSSVRQPLQQLAEAEAALAETLRQLSGSPELPAGVVEQAWRTACDTAAGLREVAAKVDAVELAARHAPAGERAALDEGVRRLRTRLDEGLDGYRGLVAAAGRMLLASAPVLVTEELVEATESLAGLGEALHELSAPDQDDYRS
jgi:hypothetical protein